MICDVNIGYGVWPFRTAVRTVPALVKKLSAAGINSGWVHSMENIWSYDIDRINEMLCKAWKNYPKFQIVPTLHEDYSASLDMLKNPAVPGGIIYPNYHNYPLDSLTKIPAAVQKFNKVLLLPLRLEDERNQHPLARIAPVLCDQVIEFGRKHPGLKLLILNAKLNEAELIFNGLNGRVFFDSAFMDGLAPYKTLEEKNISGNVLFGSEAPLLEPLASVMKLQDHSGEYDNIKNLEKLLKG